MSAKTISFTRIKNDTYGNPRFVCHFINLLSDTEKATMPFESLYRVAVKRAKTIGGKKYHNKQYGGGIVFQSYNIADTERHILAAIAE